MKSVLLLSGGMDSSVALAIAKKEDGYDKAYVITFDYGQKAAKKEINCAQKISGWIGVVEHKVIKLNFIKKISYSGLTDSSIKLSASDGILEYVPMRNTIFLSIATAWAESIGADAVIIGSNPSDSTCPDNRLEYLSAFQDVVRLGSVKKDIKIYAPLVARNLTKEKIIKKGVELGVPFRWTWSCHNNKDKACGICGNCAKRIKAFEDNGFHDPIQYETGEK